MRPAHRNWKRNPRQNSIGVANRIFPPQRVASQLKILMPVGTATSRVEAAKKALPAGAMPTVNMWCAHTPRPMKAMATVAATMKG